MKVCIFGVGSVAGLVAARLARAGIEPTLVARGATLEAIETRGLTLVDRDGESTWRLPVTGDSRAAGPQDILIIGTKAHSIPSAVDAIAPLVGPETIVVTAVNGIPWWYFHALPGDWPKRHLDCVDPGGRVWRAIGPEKALGCVVYVATNKPAPNVVKHDMGVTYTLGEPDGSTSERARRVAELLEAGGLKAPLTTDIRGEVWVKLWGNLTGNPLSALLEGSCAEIGRDPAMVRLMTLMMEEAREVAAALGVRLAADIAKRIDDFVRLGEVRTSMLQDLEAGRTLEIDPILGSVAELGRMTGVATPTIDVVYELTRSKARIRGLYAPLAGDAT